MNTVTVMLQPIALDVSLNHVSCHEPLAAMSSVQFYPIILLNSAKESRAISASVGVCLNGACLEVNSAA